MQNHLIINKGKTVAISFHHAQNKHFACASIKIDNNEIKYKEQSKFLGVWLDETLKWFTHIQELSKRLSKMCFALLIVRRIARLDTTRVLYFAYFHSIMKYGIIFWGNAPHVQLIFKIQKRAIRTIMQVPKRTSCRQLFKDLGILPLPCMYLYETMVYIKTNLHTFSTNSEIHAYNTRIKENLSVTRCKTSLCTNNLNHMGTRMYNFLPHNLKEISALSTFKKALFRFLIDNSFYSLNEYFEKTTH